MVGLMDRRHERWRLGRPGAGLARAGVVEASCQFVRAFWAVLALSGVPGSSEGGAWAGELSLRYHEIELLVRSATRGRSVVVACGRAAQAGVPCDGGRRIVVGWKGSSDSDVLQPMFVLDAPEFSSLGGRYALRPATSFSLAIEAKAAPHGLDLTVAADNDVHFAAVCVSGACTDAALLPRLAWRSPYLSLQIGPERGTDRASIAGSGAAAADGRLMQIREIQAFGRFELECPGGWGLAPAVCTTVRVAIGDDVSILVQAALEALRAKANARGLATLASSALAPASGGAAAKGAWGALRIRNIEGDAWGVRISFCLRPDCA